MGQRSAGDVMQNISAHAFELLQLLQWRGVGAAKVRKISQKAHVEGETVLYMTKALLRKSDIPSRAANGEAHKKAALIVDDCVSLGIQVLAMNDTDYPELLKEIEDYPPIIYVKGSVNAIRSGPSLAVVGTRETSKLGASWAYQIGELLAMERFVVVSGLARGIDAAAHAGALQGNGSTVAVLAHGLHTVTPASNKGLAKEILERDGALVSEHAPGVPPRKAEFVRRNRIQSGLSIGSIVVESGETGGAIHQANFTKRQGRMLYVVAPPLEMGSKQQFNYGGADYLVKHVGAIALRSSKQLRDELLRIRKDSVEAPQNGDNDDDEQLEFGW